MLRHAVINGTEMLEAEVFSGCTALSRCDCNEVTVIGNGCFRGCESLADFNFSHVIHIGEYAFADCSSLLCITLDSSTYVSAHGFENCAHLERLAVNRHELQFGSYGFSGCTALRTVVLRDDLYSLQGYGSLFDKSLPILVRSIYACMVSCFEINEQWTIERYMNTGKAVGIPNGIRGIMPEVFRDALNLCEIHIPESVSYIGARAFADTQWIESKRRENDMVTVNDFLIDAVGCRGHVVIPADVRVVSGWSFANCFGLTEVTLLSEYTRVEEFAFRNCIFLQKVHTWDGRCFVLEGVDTLRQELPPVIKQIFTDCLYCFKLNEDNILIESTGNIHELVLAKGIKGIGERIYKESNLLTEITLSDETAFIGTEAFMYCQWLTVVRNARYLSEIGKCSFAGCTSLKSIELSDNLRKIGSRAFEHCVSLESILIPEGVAEIPEKAFYRCQSLKKISLPSTVKVIGKEAFAFCTALEEIEWKGKPVSIGDRAFVRCPAGDVNEV